MLLNKSYPAIGKAEDFRPIAISSMVMRFLETALKDSLKRFGKERMVKEQCGFIGGVGIEVCRKRLIDKLMELKRRKQRAWVLFVDFSGAYNRVDRVRLERLMRERKVFEKEEDLELWKFIASNT